MRTKVEKTGPFENVGEGLYRYVPTGKYYARIQVNYKEVKKSLRTTDAALAKRRLRDLRDDFDRMGGVGEQVSLRTLCDRYLKTVQNLADKTVAAKERAAKAIQTDLPSGPDVLISKISNSQIRSWLASYTFGAESYNSYLEFVRAAFAMAVSDRLLAHSPVEGIKTRKRKTPDRTTPTVTEFNAIVANIREQRFADTADDSGDLVEFMGFAGLGQAEIWRMEWHNIHWERNQMTAFRAKTGVGFPLPLFPVVRILLERIREERGTAATPDAKIFRVKDPRAAVKNACKRLGLYNYTPRSFRRLFITLALEAGVNVKTVAAYQGHLDGGKLVLGMYGQLTDKHAAEQGEKMTPQMWERT